MNFAQTRRAAAALLALAIALPASAADSEKTLKPGGGAEVYGLNKKLACKGGAFDALDYELRRALEKSGRKLEADGRLCAIAGTILSSGIVGADEPVPAHVVAFLASHYGLVRSPKSVFVKDLDLGERRSEKRSQSAEDAISVAQAFSESLPGLLTSFQQPRWGMASTRRSKTVIRVVIVLDDRVLELDDVPRRLEAGKQAAVSGRVLPPYTNASVAVSDVKGQVTKAEPTGGDAFKAELSCGDSPGDLWVEVQADKDGQRAKVVTFPVACGKELPTSVALSTEAWPTDARGQEKRFADGVNAQRATAGVAKLEWDEGLAGVAREAAALLRDQVAKGEAPGVQLEPLLEKAGVASVLVLMNPSQAPTPADVEGQFAATPNTRQNSLHPEVNRIGVGVVPATAGGKPAVFVVELFTKFLEKVDPKQVQESLYAEVGKRRAAAGKPELARDPKLEKVAQEYAVGLAEGGGKMKQEYADEITGGIRIAFKGIDLVEGAKANPLDFAESAVASAGTAVGIGVAQGDSPVLGKNAVFVTVIAATPRTADAGKPKPAAAPAKAPGPKPKPAQKKK